MAKTSLITLKNTFDSRNNFYKRIERMVSKKPFCYMVKRCWQIDRAIILTSTKSNLPSFSIKTSNANVKKYSIYIANWKNPFSNYSNWLINENEKQFMNILNLFYKYRPSI